MLSSVFVTNVWWFTVCQSDFYTSLFIFFKPLCLYVEYFKREYSRENLFAWKQLSRINNFFVFS